MKFELKAWFIYLGMLFSLVYFAVEIAVANNIFFNRRYQTWNDTTFKESLAVFNSLTNTTYSWSTIASLSFLALANIYFWQKRQRVFLSFNHTLCCHNQQCLLLVDGESIYPEKAKQYLGWGLFFKLFRPCGYYHTICFGCVG